MNEFSKEQKFHHYIGIEMNMQTWNLLGKKDRSEQDDIRMVMFANASLFHWKNSPKFQPVNEQRGEWLIAHVYSVLRMGEEAMLHAEKTLKLTEKHGFKDFDLAYAYECLARASAASGNKSECKKWYKKAEQCGELISDKKDKEIFEGDLKSEPWFGC
jgi:hypothetical protein